MEPGEALGFGMALAVAGAAVAISNTLISLYFFIIYVRVWGRPGARGVIVYYITQSVGKPGF